jgi:UDP-GlcNAc:undecaprenyl-phosphate GlcNAc-1-phosphate transferase
MVTNYVFTILGAFLLSLFLNNFFRKLFLRKEILISQEIPLSGGLAMAFSFVIVSLLSFSLLRMIPREIIGIIIASAVMFIFALIDDWKALSIIVKFMVQIIATAFLIFFGVKTQIAGMGNLLNLIITFIWVLGITNAFNHLDVLDGAAGGTGVIVCFALFLTSFFGADAASTILLLALIGGILGFLIYNLPPARVYMGNSGSHFLGFTLAAIALIISYAPLERRIALASPLLILGLPIFDTIFLILMRLKQGKSIFKKSDDHLALRFLKLMRSKDKALFSVLSLALLFAICGVIVSSSYNQFGLVVIAFVIVISLLVAIRMSKIVME